jgi:hypothetical protein
MFGVVVCHDEAFLCDGHRSQYVGMELWDLLLEIGELYGWKPKGTIPDLDSSGWITDKNIDLRQRMDYVPSMWSYQKIVTPSDALDWSHALERFVSAVEDENETLLPKPECPPNLIGKVGEHPYKLRKDPALFKKARGFAWFLRKGGFRFNFDD